jgi:hypothetical protein
MGNFEEKRRLAWEEFASHSIEPLNPATALAYQSLFYAGFGAGYESATDKTNLRTRQLIQDGMDGIK